MTDLKDIGDKVQVHFEDTTNGLGGSISVDLVMVADGSNSSIRGMLMPEVKRQYADYVLERDGAGGCHRGAIQPGICQEVHFPLHGKGIHSLVGQLNSI